MLNEVGRNSQREEPHHFAKCKRKTVAKETSLPPNTNEKHNPMIVTTQFNKKNQFYTVNYNC